MNLNEEITLTCAFRYALGRQSYVVGSVVDNMISKWSEIPKDQKYLYRKEILDHKKRWGLGMNCDAEAWLKIVKLVDDETGE